MKVLVIGNDPKIFFENSENFSRAKEYSNLFEELHIISPSADNHSFFSREKLFLWPTRPLFPFGWLQILKISLATVREKKIDMIDAQDPAEYGFLAWLVSGLTRLPLRLQIHTDIMSPFYRRASWRERLRYRLANFLIPRADYIRVVSERIRKSILTHQFLSAEKMTVLPIYTDISPFLNAVPNAQIEERFDGYLFKIIAVGRFVDKEKNFSMLIEAMKDFVKTYPESVLVIVGDGPDGESLKFKVKSLKLEKNIVLEPWRNDLPSFLKSFDLFVLPSNYEGWGRAVIEAMASGLPILMTDVGVAGEVVGNESEGMVVPVKDTEALLRAMIYLYNNKDRLKQLGESALRKVLELKPETKKEYLELYKKSFEDCLNI